MAVKTVRRNTKLYFKIIKLLIRSRTTFRFDFFTMTVSVFLKEASRIAILWVILDRFKAVGGWTLWEMGVLYSMTTFINRFFLSFFGGAEYIGYQVLAGDLDDFLITPVNPFFLLLAKHTNAWRSFYNISILLMFIFCAVKAGVTVTAATVVVFLVFVASASVILLSFHFFIGTLSFWLLKVEALSRLLKTLSSSYSQYPIHIYGKVLGFIFSFIIPIGFISYYPSAVLLSKIENVLYNPYLGYFSPLIAAAFFLASYRFWLFGLKYYCSTGT